MTSRATLRTLYIFAKVERRRHSLERAEAELHAVVVTVPTEDMERYMADSQEIIELQTSRCKVCRGA